LVSGQRPREVVRAMTDGELVDAFRALQLERTPERLADLRASVGWVAKGELDTLLGVPHLATEPIDAVLAHRVATAFETPVVMDPGLGPREIRVVPRGGILGGLGGVEIHIGPGARLGDVLMHGGTILTGKRLAGFAGIARRVALAVDSLLGDKLPRSTVGGHA